MSERSIHSEIRFAHPAPGTVETSVPILLVDDREENLTALEAVLASPGYNLIKARSGDDALRYLLDGFPALILMDVQMPHLDGYETASIIKGNVRTRDIPIIFVTANHTSDRFLQQGYEYGAIDYLFKPFDTRVLRSKVAVLADLHRKTERLVKAERLLRESENRDRERRIAELELRSLRREQIEQKRYRCLVDGIDHGIVWSADPETLSISFVSPTAEKLTGYSVQDWLRSPTFFLGLMDEVDRQTFTEAVGRAVKSGAEVQIEHRLRMANGVVSWFQTGMRLTANASGSGSELRGLSIDVTRLKMAEQTLAREKNRSDWVARASLLLTSSLDISSNLRSLMAFLRTNICDFCVLETFDQTSEKLFLAAADQNQDAEVLLAFEQHPFELSNEERAEWDHGYSRQWEAVSTSALREMMKSSGRAEALSPLQIRSAQQVGITVRGKLVGVLTLAYQREHYLHGSDLSLAEDIAFRVAAALENADLYQKAEAAVGLRDEFLSIASHELRTPLTPLSLHLQMLKRLINELELEAPKALQVTKAVDICNRQVKRLSSLVDELLDVTKITRGKFSLNFETFELTALIREIGSRFSSQLELANCVLSMQLDKPIEVTLDPLRIEQVFVNLLTNAIKYAPGTSIEISAIERDGEVLVSFRDYGTGVSAEDQSRIFNRFERAVSATKGGGLGLGLFIVRQILEFHGGSIRVESELGRGSNFIVKLPKSVSEFRAETASIDSPAV